MDNVLHIPTALEKVEFLSKGIPPPSNVYIGKDDCLFITTYASVANLRVDVRGRILLANGRATIFEFSNVPTSNRAENTVIFALGEGWMLNVAAFLGSGSCKRGQCYVVIGLAQGKESSNFKHTIIAQGYVGTQVNQAWPGNRLEQPTEGAGVIRQIIGTNPAVGASLSEAVPTGARWRLMAFSATLVTSATVANRRVIMQINFGGNSQWQAPAPVVQAASLGYVYSWGGGIAFETAPLVSLQNIALPVGVLLPAGALLNDGTINFDAGDNWGPPFYLVEEWIEP